MSQSHGLTLPSAEALADLPADGGSDWNRLVFESSPYLLQHAANPVDWRPWGPEAFAEAKERDVPLFVSIGYATCHWCHVMERESFEDDEVAAKLNKEFVCIKIDKEERPDLDDIYMTACQALTGHGGWPLTVVLTHDKRPFFAGTYYPKHSRAGRIGMMDLIPRLSSAWKKHRDKLLEDAAQITQHIAEASSNQSGEMLGEETLHLGFKQLQNSYDAEWGGSSGRPKFPTPHHYTFLLRWYHLTGEAQALTMTADTLRHMRNGGMYDHVGFGFHRYSTDERWLLPHFEKMLYDQAMLAMAYLETWQATGDEFYARTAREIFAYVQRDMTDPDGGFFSAEDADAEGEEGKFTVWTEDEVIEALGPDDGRTFARVFRFHKDGNFHDEATGRLTGQNIPHLGKEALDVWAERLKFDETELHKWVEAIRQKLFDAREKRIHPLKDDKILTDWNGLMIAAFAMGGRILNDPQYTQAAERAAVFARDHLHDADGNLRKRSRLGKTGLPAHLDDHAFLAWGYLELHQATQDHQWLQAARDLIDVMIERFADSASGAMRFADMNAEDLLIESRKIYDGALPSGNSVAACNLLHLYRLTGEVKYQEQAHNIIKAFAGQVSVHPVIATQLLSAVHVSVAAPPDLVLVGDPNHPKMQAMRDAVNARFRPGFLVLVKDPNDTTLAGLAPFTADMQALDDQPTAYLCREFACQAPTNDLETLVSSLDGSD